jgi:putative transcriptional regulator
MTDLTNSLLIATPTEDPFFAGTIIYINQHESRGSVGLVLNKPMKMEDQIVFEKIKPTEFKTRSPVLIGGPISQNTMFMLERKKDQPVNILSQQSIEGLDEENHNNYQMIVGLAGWSSNQLDEEIHLGSWIVIPADLDIIFHPKIEQRYSLALQSLGIKPHQLAPACGHA